MPLPPGNWVVMQRTVAAIGPDAGGTRAPVVSTTLLRLRYPALRQQIFGVAGVPGAVVLHQKF